MVGLTAISKPQGRGDLGPLGLSKHKKGRKSQQQRMKMYLSLCKHSYRVLRSLQGKLLENWGSLPLV